MGRELFVVAMKRSEVLVFDLDDLGAGIVDRIPVQTPTLLALDPDGIPNCSALAVFEDQVAVLCAVRDDSDRDLSPRGPGQVVMFDPRTRDVSPPFSLVHRGPIGRLVTYRDTLLVSTVTDPTFVDLTGGCLEQVDVAGRKSTCLIENREIGGFAASYLEHPDGSLLLAATRGYDERGPIAELLSFAGADIGARPMNSDGRPFDLATCPTGHVVAADGRQGLRVWNSSGLELTGEPLDIGLPPVQGGIVCY